MVTILYRPNSEHERQVLDLQRELLREQVIVQLVNVDSKDGSTIARLYDIVRYPGILLIEPDGRLLQAWSGEVPQLQDIVYLAHA